MIEVVDINSMGEGEGEGSFHEVLAREQEDQKGGQLRRTTNGRGATEKPQTYQLRPRRNELGSVAGEGGCNCGPPVFLTKGKS